MPDKRSYVMLKIREMLLFGGQSRRRSAAERLKNGEVLKIEGERKMFENGLPNVALLLFTMLIWGLYFMILVSSPRNKVNQWCFIAGFLLSVGVLKEYIYYGGFLAGRQVALLGVVYEADELLNSILTAVLYYMAMPCAVICGLYFARLDQRFPRLFHLAELALFLPMLCFCIVYPWSQTRVIPLTNDSAYTIVAVYNLIYGVLATIPIACTLARERNSYSFRQRRLVSVIVLLPLWYWLITIFGFHLLGLEDLYKVWQGNVVIILCLFVYYLYHLFHEGIWGMRLSREHFDWSEEPVKMPENTRYMVHMLKNEMAKQRLSVQFIRELEIPETRDELNIIERSIEHIEKFAQKSTAYTGEIHIEAEPVNIPELLRNVADEQTGAWRGQVKIEADERYPELICDPVHMREALGNLVSNALDAMGEQGTLTLSYRTPKRDVALIRVADTGRGIPEQEIGKIFEMYYSGYSDLQHFGLGLSYCRNVVKAHGGYIQIRSSTEPERHGTEFTLCLPRRKRGRRKPNE